MIVLCIHCHDFFGTSLIFAVEYGMCLLLFDTLYHYYLLKQVTLKLIKYLLTIIKLIDIDTTIKNNFQAPIFVILKFFQFIWQCTFYIRLRMKLIELFYSIVNKFNCRSFITNCITCNKDNWIVKRSNIL